MSHCCPTCERELPALDTHLESCFACGEELLGNPFRSWDASPDLAQVFWDYPENRWSSADNARIGYFSHDVMSELVKERLYGYPPGEFRVAIGLQGT